MQRSALFHYLNCADHVSVWLDSQQRQTMTTAMQSTSSEEERVLGRAMGLPIDWLKRMTFGKFFFLSSLAIARNRVC